MHELAVTESIVEIVARHAAQANARRVTRISLVLGDLAGYIEDSIRFCFDFVSQNTVTSGAELQFQRVPVELHCPSCGHTWQPEGGDWTCPACSAVGAQVLKGREFYVESIEVDEEPASDHVPLERNP